MPQPAPGPHLTPGNWEEGKLTDLSSSSTLTIPAWEQALNTVAQQEDSLKADLKLLQ